MLSHPNSLRILYEVGGWRRVFQGAPPTFPATHSWECHGNWHQATSHSGPEYHTDTTNKAGNRLYKECHTLMNLLYVVFIQKYSTPWKFIIPKWTPLGFGLHLKWRDIKNESVIGHPEWKPFWTNIILLTWLIWIMTEIIKWFLDQMATGGHVEVNLLNEVVCWYLSASDIGFRIYTNGHLWPV